MRQPLFLLPFDHRKTFVNEFAGESPEELKWLIYESFLRARNQVKQSESLGILVDEQYGKKIIIDAKKKGVTLAVSVEKSGQQVFDFEFSDYAKHIADVDADYVKVLVRYNPANQNENQIQLERLEKLSDFCTRQQRKLLLELLVPATPSQLSSLGGVYDDTERIYDTAGALEQIQKMVSVDIWKLEGGKKEQWTRLLPLIKPSAPVIVLGRGSDMPQVNEWNQQASHFSRIIGFAVGRTIFMDPLGNYHRKFLTKDAAVAEMSDRFLTCIKLWQEHKKHYRQIDL